MLNAHYKQAEAPLNTMDSSESSSLFHTNTYGEAVKRKKDEYEYPIADKTQVAVEITIKQSTMAKVRCCLFILKHKICQFCKRLKVNIKRTKTLYGHFRDFPTTVMNGLN